MLEQIWEMLGFIMCPFCNSRKGFTHRMGWWRVACSSCGTVGAKAYTKQNAIKKWKAGETDE